MNIRSMTGFGRAERIVDDCRISAEIRSVNHRYLDMSIKMPRRFNAFEARLRQLFKEKTERGKVDIYISYDDYAEHGRHLIYNRRLAEEYITSLNAISEDFNLRNDVSNTVLARFPDVLVMSDDQEDEDRLFSLLKPVCDEALEAFIAEREREGAELRSDLIEKLELIESSVEAIERLSPSVVESYKKRLYDKMKEVLSEQSVSADEGRIVTEVAIYADKVCTDEEMVRLKAHTKAMKDKLNEGGVCGRELDFIAQEMNREANTTLSKANSLEISDTAIALKTTIEKIREQVQNIE